MSDPTQHQTDNVPLNPALKSVTDTTYDTETSTPPPLDTTNTKEGQGEGWPIIWLVVTVLCVAVTVYFII